MSKYVKIVYSEFKALMDDMNFIEVDLKGVYERVWRFPIGNSNFEIRVYSTIGVSTSRSNGSDSIKCLLYDAKENKILSVEKRVHRTKSTLKNTRERCRELFIQVRDNKCTCGGLMIEKTSKTQHKFLGCTNYPKCTNTKNQITPQLKLKLKT